jgi:hypothetical protein
MEERCKGFLEPLSGHLLGRVVVTLPATRFSIQIFHTADSAIMRLGTQQLLLYLALIDSIFFTESEGVYLAVRTESLNVFQGILNL